MMIPIATHVEAERTRLTKAELVLGCVAFALDHSAWTRESGTDYASVVQLARELVQESIDRLDRINFGSRSVESQESQPQP